MLTPAISKVRESLGSWRNLLALGTLPLLGAWIFSRVWMVNPAILGDEYLYSMNARKVGPWDPPVAGDFSNYLFNFVYQGTNLCGDAFYACGKIFNIVFFLGFIFTMFILALRFLPFWGCYAFMIAAALSPLSVYTSMFLPESMYFFFIGLVLVAVLRAMRAFTWQNWALAGAAIGVTSLVKPHAWLSAIAVGITLLVVGLFNKEIGFKKTFVAGLGLVAGAALARVLVGLMVAGPKALGFFGQYFGVSTIQTVISGAASNQDPASLPQSPIGAVIALFPAQLNIHVLTVVSVMSLAIVGLFAGLVDLIRKRRLTDLNAFSLFAFIWLASLILEIVIFTGWVTGSGDDHSVRVLIRYYEFLFLIVPLAGMVSLKDKLGENMNVFLRWGAAGVLATLLTTSYSGFFGTLSIQIADAPTLAGLVVSLEIFNIAALVAVSSLLLFAAFPRLSPYAFLAVLPITFIAIGWQAQEQYVLFRGDMNSADLAGKALGELPDEQIATTHVLGSSRFEATNVAFWSDNPDLTYEIALPGDYYAENAPETKEYILAFEGVNVIGATPTDFGWGDFTLFKID